MDGFPNSKMTGVYIDKNGNWKIQANLVVLVNVETLPGRWESVRSIYITAVFKFKIVKDGSLQFVFSPKNIEISELKVMNGD